MKFEISLKKKEKLSKRKKKFCLRPEKLNILFIYREKKSKNVIKFLY